MDHLFADAVYEKSEPDRKQRDEIKEVHKYKAVFPHDNEAKLAHLTVREYYEHGNKLYSLEIQKIEKHERDTLEDARASSSVQSIFNEKLQSKVDEVKKSLDDRAFSIGGQNALTFGRYYQEDEGDEIFYELKDAPEWVYIQSNASVFSNFGPPESEIGKTHTFTVEASTNGQSVTL